MKRLKILSRLGLAASVTERWSGLQAQISQTAAENELLILGPIVPSEEKEFWDEFMESGKSVTVSDASARARLAEIDGDVKVRINSPGGDVYAASGIYMALAERAQAGDKVSVVVDGIAASAGSLVMLAGQHIAISPLGSIMIHEVWACMCGNAADFRTAADHMERENDQFAALYASRMKASDDEARQMLAEETWFGAQEALDAGLVDEIVTVSAGDKPKPMDMAAFLARRSQNMARLHGAA